MASSSRSKPVVSLHGDNPAPTFKIEKNVPRPPERGTATRAIRALAAADIGDSVVVRCKDANSLSGICFHAAGSGWYTTAKISVGEFRVWKIA